VDTLALLRSCLSGGSSQRKDQSVTTAEFLALPVFESIGYHETVVEGQTVYVPFMRDRLVMPMTDSTIVIARDEDDVAWSPVMTKDGLMRERNRVLS